MPYENETFGRLISGAISAIARFENKKVKDVAEEIGIEISRSHHAIQHYMGGLVPDNLQTVQVLITAGATRSYLTRLWAEKVIALTPYKSIDTIDWLNRIFKESGSKSPKPVWTAERRPDNLPPPTYSQFIMRAEPFAEVLDGLRQRSALVVILSLGGMGKTSLAREVVSLCLGRHMDLPQSADPALRFDAAVWVSDKDQPGTMTLQHVLDEIAYTLDYPGYTELDPTQKQREIERLLKYRRVLVVVDNFETIIDDALAHWLLRLPEPSKGLLTTRKHQRAFQRGAWLVELSGLSNREAGLFIPAYTRQLRLKHALDDQTQREISELTGGNPKAIELLLGLHKRTGLPISQLAERVRTVPEELLDELFIASWELLSADAQTILLAMTLFHNNVAIAALSSVAGISEPALLSVLQELISSALIEIVHIGAQPDPAAPSATRYTLHRLTRQFVISRQTTVAAALDSLRGRWLQWAVNYLNLQGSDIYGFMLRNAPRLREIDADEPTLAAAIAWAFAQGRYAETIRLVKQFEFYYYTRGWWNKKLELHQLYIQAAHALYNQEEEVLALTMHIQLLSRQGRTQQAEPYVATLHELLAQAPMLADETRFNVYHAEGLYSLAAGRFAEAEHAWRQVVNQGGGCTFNDHTVMGTRLWLGSCLYRQGRRSEAREQYLASQQRAQELGYARTYRRTQLALAIADLDDGNLDAAKERLIECVAQADGTDYEQQAQIQETCARLLRQQGDMPAAFAAQRAASNLLRQMGRIDEAARLDDAL